MLMPFLFLVIEAWQFIIFVVHLGVKHSILRGSQDCRTAQLVLGRL
jgi:hypothetical protein